MAYASRHTSYVLGSIGCSIQVIAGWWDVYSHLLFEKVDPWWNPAHLTLYFGVALVILAVWRGLHTARIKPAYATPIRFANTSELKLAGFGVIIQIIAGVWNEIVHHLLLTEPKIAPAHALLTFGMLAIGFGMIIGLSIENGMIRHDILIVSEWKRWLTVACVILTFASIWLAAAGSLIYIARVFRGNPLIWLVGVLLAFVASLVLVPTKRVLHDLGSATSTGAIFNCVAFVLLVGYAGAPAYVPWALIPLALFDVLVLLAKRAATFRRAVLFSSLVTSLPFYATYYPFTLYLFPWASSIGLPVVAVVAGGFVGSCVGDRAYSGLSSFLLSGIS